MADLPMIAPRGSDLYGGGAAMPRGNPAPTGVPMGPYGNPQAPGFTPRVTTQDTAPRPVSPYVQQPNRTVGGDFAMVDQPQATPLPSGIGQNGFGVHPEVGHNDIVDYLLPKFRSVESSGNYQAQHKDYPKVTASGAYGYTDGTWNHFQGYPRAKDAPPEVQDARMRQDLLAQLQRFQGDPFKVVAHHYYPKFAHDPTQWNTPLVDNYGKPIQNAQTVQQYLEGILPAERVSKYLAGMGNAQRPGS